MKPTFNFPLALASIVMAVMLWVYVRSEAALILTRKVDFSLRYFGLNEDRFVVKSIPKTVAVQVEGTAEELDRFSAVKPASLIATVDLSDAQPELSTYRVRIPRNDVIDRTGVTVRLLSDEVAIIVEEVTEREMDVTLDPYNAPPGLVFASAEIRPQSVRLRGPIGDLAKVDQVRARVDLSRAIGRSVPVTLELIDRNQRPVESVRCLPAEVVVAAQLDKVAPTKSVLVSLRLAAGTRPAPGYRLIDYSLSPTTLTVRGEMNLLASLRSVETEPIQLDGLRAPSVVRARVNLPKGVSADRTTVEVRLRVEPIPSIESPHSTGSAGSAGPTGGQ